MPIARSTQTGIASGVVLLAVAAGFGIGLPKAIEDPGAAVAVPALPDRIGDNFVAYSAITYDDAQATEQAQQDAVDEMVATYGDLETTAAANLGGQYGDAAVRSYADLSQVSAANPQPAIMAVTVVPGEPGLVLPQGPIGTDDSEGVLQHYELREVGGHHCALQWTDPYDPTTGAPTGEPAAASAYQVQCRTSEKGLTFDIVTSGVLPEDAAALLDQVVEETLA